MASILKVDSIGKTSGSTQDTMAGLAKILASLDTTGTAEIEGSTITWIKDETTGSITLEIIDDEGTTTTITIPGAGEFNF